MSDYRTEERQENGIVEARRERSLLDVIDKIRRTLDLETIFQTTVVEVRQLLQADRVGVFRFDKNSGYHRGEFVSEDVLEGFPVALAAKVEDHCFGENHVNYYEKGKIFALDDIYKSQLQECHIALLDRFQVKANLVAPLMEGNELWGLLCIHQCNAPRAWRESEIEFTSKIALNLGIAIQQAELLAQSRKRSEELQQALKEIQRQQEYLTEVAFYERAIVRTIEKIGRTLDLKTIYEVTTEETRGILKCDRVVIYRFDEDWSGEFVHESRQPGLIPLTDGEGGGMRWPDTYLQETEGGRYRSRETFVVDNVYRANLTDCHLEILEKLGIKSLIVVPVFVGDRLWGLLGAYQNSDFREWKPNEVNLLAQVGDRLGVGINQANLLSRTEEQSRMLKMTLADLNAIVDNLADGLLVTDMSGKISRFNPSLRSMFDLDNIELKGKFLKDVFPPSLAALILKNDRRGEGVVTARVELSGGREGQALASSIFKDFEEEERGQCSGSVILIRDVTKEREIDRVKTEFLANVSHELRTPLTSVLGFAALIQEKLETVIFPALPKDNLKISRARERVGKHIGIIISEAERLTELIGDVLDIAKMEAGQLDWNTSPTPPFEILERAIATVEPLCRQKNLTLVQSFDRDLPLVMVDRNRLLQVVINLLSNAIKFTDPSDTGVGVIECRAGVENNRLLVGIRDTGIGIEPGDRLLIFDRFKQVGNIFTDKPKGTGLGLPICKQIIEYHGGEIWVESQVGKGTTFYFTLPLL